MNLDIDELFQELKRRCEPKDVYSVREVAAGMKINYDYIELIASQDPEKNEILQLCRCRCWCNMMDAGMKGKLPIREVHRYWLENDDEYARDNNYEQIFDDEKDQYS